MKSLITAFLLLLSLAPARAQESKPEPQNYLDLHRGVLNPAGPGWKAIMEKLQQKGDAFTIEYLKQIKTAALDPKSAALVASVLDAAGKRLAAETDATFVKQIEPWLQSAALADITCDPIEGILPQWVLKKVRENLDRPGVRAEVTRIRNAPAAPGKGDSLMAIAATRAKSYAGRILDAASPDAVGGAVIPSAR